MIYLDNNATTRPADEVVEAVLAALREGWGNPSSLHDVGSRAYELVEGARTSVARLVGAKRAEEVVFTSGGTESINTAIHSVLTAAHGRSRVLTSATEHSAVERTLATWSERGFECIAAPVDGEGRIDVQHILERLDEHCALLSLHYANNETGVVLADDDVRLLSERARASGVPFHLDAVQIPGKLPLEADALGVDLLSISAHKFHGPKGAGALWVRGGGPLAALVRGGPQEGERRGGTENVPGIAGLGRAAELAHMHVADPVARERVRALRDRLETVLLDRLPDASVHGANARRLDNTSSLFVPGIDGELLLASLAAEGIAVSAGAACSARRRGPSPVILAMGRDEEEAARTVRFSLARTTTTEEIEQALQIVPRVVEELAALQLEGP